MGATPYRVLLLPVMNVSRLDSGIWEEMAAVDRAAQAGPASALSVDKPASWKLTELHDLLGRSRPQSLHLACHTDDAGMLHLPDENGLVSPAQTSVLVDLLQHVGLPLDCIVLSSCSSEPMAQAFLASARFVIAMRGNVSSAVTCAFATGFYSSIVSGNSVQRAVDYGHWHVRQVGGSADLVTLHVRPGCDPKVSVLVPAETTLVLAGQARAARIFAVPTATAAPFFPRDEHFQELHAQLTQQRMVALVATSGAGKTQVAIRYATQQCMHYPVILWLACTSYEAFTRGVSALWPVLHEQGLVPTCDENDLRRQRELVLAYLKTAKDYLLICDGLDDPPSFAPARLTDCSGHILVTSTRRDVLLLGMQVLDLPLWTHEESQRFLSDRHPAPDSTELAALSELAHELGGLPLALSLAAAFLSVHRGSYVVYLREYRRQGVAWLDRTPLLDGAGRTVGRTLQLSFQRLQRDEPASAELLKICAFLDGTSIPEELFEQPCKELPPVLRRALGSASDTSFDILLGSLVRHCLAGRNAPERLFTLHPLVQAAVQSVPPTGRRAQHRLGWPRWLPHRWLEAYRRRQRRRYVEAALAQLDAMFPEDTDAHWIRCQRLAAQAIRLSEHSESLGLVSEHAGRALLDIGCSLRRDDKLDLAGSLSERGLAILQRCCEPTHPMMATAWNDLGLVRMAQGRLDEAEGLLRLALELRQHLLPKTDPRIAISLDNRADLHITRGELDLADPLYEQAQAIFRQVYGDSHEDLAICLSIGARLRAAQNRWPEAEELRRKALRIDCAVFGVSHPRVALSLRRLVRVLLELGKLDEARFLSQEAVKLCEGAFGEDHSFTSNYLLDLVDIADAQDQPGEAVRLLERAHKIREAAFGAEHDATLHCAQQLASTLWRAGDLARAEDYYRWVLTAREKQSDGRGASHGPSLYKLADLLLARGSLAEANQRSDRAVAILRQEAGSSTEELTDCLDIRGRVLHALGRLSEAESLLRESLQRRRQATSSESGVPPWDVAVALDNLGAVLASLGQLDEADTLTNQALQAFEQQPDGGGSSLATCLEIRAGIAVQRWQLSEAERLLREGLRLRGLKPQLYPTRQAALLGQLDRVLLLQQHEAMSAKASQEA